MTAGHSGTLLAGKLGIKPGSRALVAAAPPGWALGGTAATVHTRAGAGPYDVILVFCPDVASMVRQFPRLSARLTTAGALWVAWPKKSGGMATDLSEGAVREYGLESGLVDVLVCAVDETWSGLKFVRRLRDR
ncbi:MAG: hypothetical protein QOF39_1736 [Frankiales bacterium]|jgi:coenzyme F420-reducing hydrogenase beta subunit|nr:hypothetical protein [Frankiales bacterium]